MISCWEPVFLTTLGCDPSAATAAVDVFLARWCADEVTVRMELDRLYFLRFEVGVASCWKDPARSGLNEVTWRASCCWMAELIALSWWMSLAVRWQLLLVLWDS